MSTLSLPVDASTKNETAPDAMTQPSILYNAADRLLERNLVAERGERIAVIDSTGPHSYREVNEGVNRFANVLKRLAIHQEQRILLCLNDSVDFIVCFLGAIRAGIVPVPVNTLLTSDDYAYLLSDSRARLLVVSEALEQTLKTACKNPSFLEHTLVSSNDTDRADSLARTLRDAEPHFSTAPTRPDDIAFWLYTSGTTGKAKGVMHLQTHLEETALCYAEPVLGMTKDDTVFSAAKLFFAYGLGNALTFPFALGATTVLMQERATDESVKHTLDQYQPTLFFGVPTLYAMMLNNQNLPDPEKNRLRLCISAGEALPETILSRWKAQTGVNILDGIGSTELLHIFISNRPGDICPGTSGRLVDGYSARLLDESGRSVADGEIGELFVRGPTAAAGYWNLRDKSRDSFQGHWIKTGDKYTRSQEGYYRSAGRSDDLLKVGGIYVSPMEVENALLSHPAVAEVAVVGAADRDELIKPKAFVVQTSMATLSGDTALSENELERELIAHVEGILAHYKRPRWVVFVNELPKTSTGKIQRYLLR